MGVTFSTPGGGLGATVSHFLPPIDWHMVTANNDPVTIQPNFIMRATNIGPLQFLEFAIQGTWNAAAPFNGFVIHMPPKTNPLTEGTFLAPSGAYLSGANGVQSMNFSADNGHPPDPTLSLGGSFLAGPNSDLFLGFLFYQLGPTS